MKFRRLGKRNCNKRRRRGKRKSKEILSSRLIESSK
jgi:hypothetical protein